MPDQTAAPPGEPGRGRRRWRVGTPLVLLVCGGLFVVSAQDSDGTDLRPGRSTDLGSVVSAESRDVEGLQTRAATLGRDVRTRTAAVDDEQVDELTREVRRLEPAAGRTPVSGAGVSVTLSDAPLEKQRAYAGNINDTVVHQQDLQAVVNALWLAGAEAVTLQGQRLITTTGIKCSGNVVRLHGIPYSQPYVIAAVGDPTRLEQALEQSGYLRIYRQYADDPQIEVGYDVRAEPRVDAPAYDGTLELSYARVAD